jgi:hypothetical protein
MGGRLLSQILIHLAEMGHRLRVPRVGAERLAEV